MVTQEWYPYIIVGATLGLMLLIWLIVGTVEWLAKMKHFEIMSAAMEDGHAKSPAATEVQP